MPYTTVSDYDAYRGTATADPERVAYWLPIAEREIARLAGTVFYDTSNTASDASQDWIVAVSLAVDLHLSAESTEARAAAASPYRSYSVADQGTSESYTLKESIAQSTNLVAGDPRILAIVSAYQLLPSAFDGVGFVLGTPPGAETATLEGAERDVSRQVWAWWDV